jgi:putative exporter of polyketide antibiotics
MNVEQLAFCHLGVSLAIGLLIGVERGWKEREQAEGRRVAGVCAYGLIGLLGGGTAQLAQHIGSWVMGLMLLAVAGALTAVYVVNLTREEEDIGITSLVAGLLTGHYPRGHAREASVRCLSSPMARIECFVALKNINVISRLTR